MSDTTSGPPDKAVRYPAVGDSAGPHVVAGSPERRGDDGELDDTTQSTSRPALNPAATITTRDKQRIVFVDLCRAAGALLVFYSHVTELWMRGHGVSSPAVHAVNVLFTDPLHMPKQGIGQVAVPLFFLVSGFVVTPIAMRQGGMRFALNRILRVYPPLIFTVILTSAVILLGLHPLSTGQLSNVTPVTVLTNSLLVNYLLVPQVILVGVAWTLIIEVIFYLLLIALLPVLRRCVWLAIALELGFVLAVLITARMLGDNYFLFAVSVSFFPIVLIGQIIWAASKKRIPLWAAGLFGLAAWTLYVWADHRAMGRLDNAYELALFLAVLFFLLGFSFEHKLTQRRIVTALSERSYSIYLLHGLVALPVLSATYPYVPVEIAILIALVATAGAVEVSYRLVERPSHRLGKIVTRRKVRTDGAEDAQPEIMRRLPDRAG